MASLYDIDRRYEEALYAVDAAETEEALEQALSALAAVDDELSHKAEQYAKAIKNREAAAAGKRAEAQRLTESARRDEAVTERLRAALLDSAINRHHMQKGDKIQTPIGAWAVRESPWKVTVLDEKAVHHEWLKFPPAQVDKSKILANFKKTGAIPDGVDITRDLRMDFR